MTDSTTEQGDAVKFCMNHKVLYWQPKPGWLCSQCSFEDADRNGAFYKGGFGYRYDFIDRRMANLIMCTG